MTKIVFLLIVTIALGLAPAQVQAQDQNGDSSGWGFSVNGTPKWQIMSAIKDIFTGDVVLEGQEITFGVSRGSATGGDWGVDFVRKGISDKSRIDNIGSTCGGFPSEQYRCLPSGQSYALRSVSLIGAEFHGFVPFVRAGRVQFGATFGGGVAKISGTAVKSSFSPVMRVQSPGVIVIEQRESTTNLSAEEAIKDRGGPGIFPLARAEVTFAVLAGKNCKLKIGSGFNFPGTQPVRIGAACHF
jgi:hypothetical protein